MNICDCLKIAPTYPLCRENIHLPDCPWYQVEILEKRVGAIEKELNKNKDE